MAVAIAYQHIKAKGQSICAPSKLRRRNYCKNLVAGFLPLWSSMHQLRGHHSLQSINVSNTILPLPDLSRRSVHSKRLLDDIIFANCSIKMAWSHVFFFRNKQVKYLICEVVDGLCSWLFQNLKYNRWYDWHHSFSVHKWRLRVLLLCDLTDLSRIFCSHMVDTIFWIVAQPYSFDYREILCSAGKVRWNLKYNFIYINTVHTAAWCPLPVNTCQHFNKEAANLLAPQHNLHTSSVPCAQI